MNTLLLKLKALGEIFAHFRNPWMVTWLRLGLLRLPLFPYQLAWSGQRCTMLARPSSKSMADLFVLREVFIEETYRDLLPLLPDRPVRAIDVGANLGSFTVWLHLRHGLKEAFCFEPEPGSFQLCRYNLYRNQCLQAQVLPKAVGATARRQPLDTGSGRPGSFNLYGDAAASAAGPAQEVEVISFLDWLQSVPGDFDVLKLDCEGAEWEILEHAPAALWRRFGLVVAEIHADPSNRRKPEDFGQRLAQYGFRTRRWDGHAQGIYLGQQEASS